MKDLWKLIWALLSTLLDLALLILAMYHAWHEDYAHAAFLITLVILGKVYETKRKA